MESEEPPSNLAASIPESLATPWTVELRLTAPTGSLSDHTETDFDMAFEELVLEELPPLGSLRIRLVGRDGVQVTGEPLLGLTPDAKGEVVLERLKPGELELCVRTPGRLPARHATLVRADQEVVATLREPAGARLEVVVVDEEGRARPTALLEIRGAAFFDVEGSTQRADLFTDHLGRRSISRMEPGQAEIHATWGSRKGFEKVTLVDGETTRVRIVAR
jgi:hypothetical protein